MGRPITVRRRAGVSPVRSAPEVVGVIATSIAQMVVDLIPVVVSVVLLGALMVGVYRLGQWRGESRMRVSTHRSPFKPTETTAIVSWPPDDGNALAVDSVDGGARIVSIRKCEDYSTGWSRLTTEWVPPEAIGDVVRALEWVENFNEATESTREEYVEELQESGLTLPGVGSGS